MNYVAAHLTCSFVTGLYCTEVGDVVVQEVEYECVLGYCSNCTVRFGMMIQYNRYHFIDHNVQFCWPLKKFLLIHSKQI